MKTSLTKHEFWSGFKETCKFKIAILGSYISRASWICDSISEDVVPSTRSNKRPVTFAPKNGSNGFSKLFVLNIFPTDCFTEAASVFLKISRLTSLVFFGLVDLGVNDKSISE